MRRVFVPVAVLTLLLSAIGPAAARDPSGMVPTSLDGELIHANKSLSGRIAQSDPELLARNDREIVNVMIKFDVDATASYQGGIGNLRATSPSVTGRSLRQNRAAVQAYERYLEQQAQAIRQDIRGRVQSVNFGTTFTTVYGGVAAQIPANRARDLLSVEGVAAVQWDRLEQPLTDASPEFIGATAVWPSLGGSATAGEGVIVGVIDTGIWPEHPSFADPGIDHPGGTYGCEFGDGSDPALGDPFTCNDKLIGAYAKTATHMAVGGSLAGEFCNNTTDQCSARDADGHGTHTASTAAGSPVESAELFGVERGPLSGIAPGAHVIAYRVCMHLGCFQSDSVSAVAQAIADGVDVLNFSISGGSNAYSDPVELAFLDAYAAGILVNASAGNAGPGAGTANHAGPWTNTVGASTSDRHFVGTLTLTSDEGDSLVLEGATVTDGVSTPTPVVLANTIAGQPDDMCRMPQDAPPGVTFPAGSLTGKIVVCRRQQGARVYKSYNASLGGATGVILYNGLPNLGLNTDNHWLPTIHVENTAAGTHPVVAFVTSHTNVMATFTAGQPTTVQGDVMTSFSSRGPVGDFIKPDVTAPGIQILAGHSPAHIDPVGGPPGELYQAIAGTSMSSPHSAGVSALIKAAHPSWTPGQIKSALMTSSLQSVLKHDGTTPADPFDRGAGSIRAHRAVAPTVTFDVSAADYYASAADPMGRIHLNLPSINAPNMPGSITTTRTIRNVSGTAQPIKITASAPAGASITVTPSNVTLPPGGSRTMTITIDGTSLADGQYFGQITLDATKAGFVDAVLPVAFVKRPGQVTLTHTCDDSTVAVGDSTDCAVSVTNLAPLPADVELSVQGPRNGKLTVRNPSDGTPSGNGFNWSGTLTPALAPEITGLSSPGDGFLSLAGFGIAPIAGMGDESIANFNIPAFRYGSETYTRIGVVSNGYAVVGGGTSNDIDFVPQDLPDPASPNNVLAPYWTDLNPAAGGGVRVALFAAAAGQPAAWFVAEWTAVPVFTGGAARTFQIWVQLAAAPFAPNGERITFEYAQVGPGDPEGLIVGAENRDGTSAASLGLDTVPALTGYVVETAPPTPGGSHTITYEAFGRNVGTFDVTASMTSNVTVGTARKVVTITVE